MADRVAAHGPIFRTHLLGRPTVILAGGETAGVFVDEELCKREGAVPSHIRELFGGGSINLLDGQEHLARKRQILAAFVPEALVAYVPGMQALVEASWCKEHRVKDFDDGLGRMLSHEDENGAKITDESAVVELHHARCAGRHPRGAASSSRASSSSRS